MPVMTARELKMERETVAANWRMFRKNNFLTQRRLAEVLGLSRRAIQKIEAGTTLPHAETLRRFAVFTNNYSAQSDLNLQG